MVIQWLSYDGFPSFPWLQGFLLLIFMPKLIIEKIKFNVKLPRFELITMQRPIDTQPFNQFMLCDNSYH